MRLATPLAVLCLAAALLAGCGSSGGTTTRPPGPGSSTEEVRSAWEGSPECKRPDGASRWACSVGPYRCQGVVADRGWSVSCARPGRAINFTVRRG